MNEPSVTNASSRGTVDAYALDLRLLFEWCAVQGLDPLQDVTRPHLELFARHLERDRGNCPTSIHRRLSTIRCFYRIAETSHPADCYCTPIAKQGYL